jgi:UDP-2,4-diacetamido-2,4,6-trideoxy-beta-L-altropyranose hydrolase
MSNKKKVVLRADASPSIGMGHFMRSLALAEMIANDFHCLFATVKPTEYQKQEINKYCSELIELPDDESHFSGFLDHLKGDEIVVLDNYFFDTSYQQKIKNIGCKLVCIDDMHDKHYVADVVINHAEGLSKDDFSIELYTKVFLGFNYALLREPFIKKDDKKTKTKFDLVVGIGGTDPLNITDKILINASPFLSKNSIAVLFGNVSEETKASLSKKNIRVFKNINANKIADIMSQSKFGIFSSSTIAIEAIAMRLPFAIGYFVDNQHNLYNGIVKNELAAPLHSFQGINQNILEKIFVDYYNNQKELEKIINNQKKSLDRMSNKRIKKIFNLYL